MSGEKKEEHGVQDKKGYASPEIVCMGDAVQLTGGPNETIGDFPRTGWQNSFPDAKPPTPDPSPDADLP